MQSQTVEKESRYQRIRQVTLLGTLVDLLLGVSKLIVGFLANSQALVADGIHSLSDVATDIFVLFAARHAHKEADRRHPYGHGRIETLATVGLGSVLLLVAVGIVWEAIQRLGSGADVVAPGWLALVISLLSVVAKEWVYRFTRAVAEQYESDLLLANAWHSRTDAISSIVVAIGVAGAMLGFTYLDAIAAVAVALMIAKIGFDLVHASGQELIDAALDAEETQAIAASMETIDGVKAVHDLRTRTSAGEVLIDVHVQVNPRISVSEGHEIGDAVRRRVTQQHPKVADIVVHIDPEDDRDQAIDTGLPLRQQALGCLRQHWQHLLPEHAEQDITLHYLREGIDVELVLPMQLVSGVKRAAELESKLKEAVSELSWLHQLKVAFRPSQPV